MKVQNRITFHFIYQLIIYAVFILIAILTLIFVMISQMANEGMQQNFPGSTLEAISTEALYEKESVKLGPHWEKYLRERNIWLQIVNVQGKVIHASNVPSEIPNQYSSSELLNIKENREINSYIVETQLDLFEEEPILYMLGYKSPHQEKLAEWYEKYNSNGMIESSAQPKLQSELEQFGGYITIVNQHGEKLQTIGKPAGDTTDFQPLELLAILDTKGDYNGQISLHRSENKSITWILHNDKDLVSYVKQPIFKDVIRMFLGAGIGILVLSLILSFWHGHRYSQPLILFAGWFERMESGRYDEVLTPKDKRKVFRKNGKLRMRYRLYREVIQTFYAMAEQLARTEKDRAQLERTREEWMSGISHDLRTPLSTIQGYGYILEQSPDQWTKEELQEMGQMIREKGDFMLELITDFSYISQLKQSTAPIETELLELNELVRRSVIKYVNDATLTGVEFQYEDHELQVFIHGNAIWLQRLMDNLISNAAKHNPPGITVSVTIGVTEGSPFIKVADNGQGMDHYTQQMLFERYYRGTNTEESSAGTGLGMSIAKMIVEAHSGQIAVHSKVKLGTEITVKFPLVHPPK